MNPKEFYTRWKDGYKNLKPIHFIKAKLDGHLWAVIGLSIGLGFMVYRGIWFFAVFVLALMYLQWWEYKKARQQYVNLKKMEEMLK